MKIQEIIPFRFSGRPRKWGASLGKLSKQAEKLGVQIILATGGFGSNFDMMTSYNPSLAEAVTTNHAGVAK